MRFEVQDTTKTEQIATCSEPMMLMMMIKRRRKIFYHDQIRYRDVLE